MFKPQTNIWQSFNHITINTPKKIPIKQSNKIKICIKDNLNTLPLFSSSNIRQKGRRKLKSTHPNDVPLHTKDNDDNIKRKIKTHFHNFIVCYLNKLMKNSLCPKRQIKFRKISSRITQDITISFNKILLNTPIKDIIIQVSSKFKNKDINLNYIEKLSKLNENNNLDIHLIELNKILNLTYKEMFEKYYLKSTKQIFINDKNDESFETHINHLINKYGFEYTMKFKQNAENFINFYLYSKQRIPKNLKNQNFSEESKNSEYEIKNLKNSLNAKNSFPQTKKEKRYFEIIRNNSVIDNSNSKTQPDSSGNSINEEEEKNEKTENKNLIGKKRNGPFNVLLCN